SLFIFPMKYILGYVTIKKAASNLKFSEYSLVTEYYMVSVFLNFILTSVSSSSLRVSH
ncbi:hypothetical protein L9F63_003285, partial [Diploptera punctata]